METINKIKKAFPIASVLFILYFLANALRLLINTIQTITIYTGNGKDFLQASLYALPVASAFLFFIPFLLMGFFTLKTDRKPSIGYIVSLALAFFIPLISFLGSIVSSLSTFEYASIIQIITNIASLLTQPLLALSIAVALAYAIIARISKKPSKIFKLWFLFPIPYIAFCFAQFITSILSLVNTIGTIAITGLTVHILSSVIATLLLFFGFFVLIIAFFAVSYQFAKVNKKLSNPKAEAITE